jgi:hypothetical protein
MSPASFTPVGYDGINRQDRDGPVQAPILPADYLNCPCLENPSLPRVPSCVPLSSGAGGALNAFSQYHKFGQKEAAATGAGGERSLWNADRLRGSTVSNSAGRGRRSGWGPWRRRRRADTVLRRAGGRCALVLHHV